jgi:hypothetical protein
MGLRGQAIHRIPTIVAHFQGFCLPHTMAPLDDGV